MIKLFISKHNNFFVFERFVKATIFQKDVPEEADVHVWKGNLSIVGVNFHEELEFRGHMVECLRFSASS